MRKILAILLLGYGVFVWWFVSSIHMAGGQMAEYQRQLSEPSPVPAAIVRFESIQKGLVVPSWKLLSADRPWVHVAAWSPLGTDYIPELTTITVAKGDWMYDNQVRPEVNSALEKLFAHASKSGQPLIVTSAYRSAADQQDLYTTSTANYGADWAASHVAKPGQSEHQTGLAADFSSYTASCLAAFAGCDLRPDTAAWLASHAHEHGFILRYPKNKSHITKISHEPWHFRYVGKDLARFVHESNLTFDEIASELKKQNQVK